MIAKLKPLVQEQNFIDKSWCHQANLSISLAQQFTQNLSAIDKFGLWLFEIFDNK